VRFSEGGSLRGSVSRKDLRDPHAPLARRCAVGIPVKDEVQRLPACLAALASQQDGAGYQFSRNDFCVVLFVNNCTDGSAALARALAESMPFTLCVKESVLPAGFAHAGNARRAAMDLAEAWLAKEGAYDGLILTTDADSQVPRHWIANNLTAIDAGADAVLGCLALDEEGERLPRALHQRGRLESAYESLLTELSAALDPLEHNPWPHHATISGASLAVTRPMYLRMGRIPRVPLGEDKAFVAELLRHDAKIRFCPDIRVTTSARIVGRAPGGVAETLRLRSNNPSVCCDESLEPFRTAIRRAKWRRRLRKLHGAGRLTTDNGWVKELAIPQTQARWLCRRPTFGAVWSAIESMSPLLVKRRLTPPELPGQILGARRALTRLRKRLSSPHNVEPERVASLPMLDVDALAHAFDQKIGGFVASQRIVGLTGPVHERDVSFQREREQHPLCETGDVLGAQVIDNF
jgi:Glycosyl transferase family 2